ncbi:PREDICTED: uncharacterized protein LOC109146618 [Ipomoea nil]|uniref:uncharacterized protein LOC109146618 n=1 Tax=Ipomoea nil TaxID=35883 RepID=UPI00090146C1|nr:PREDICTED: uncharacterized protein LOC109146618 [Ipomoea nil]
MKVCFFYVFFSYITMYLCEFQHHFIYLNKFEMVRAVLVLFFIVAALTNAHGVLPGGAPPLPFCNVNSDCLPLCRQCAICACCDGVCYRGCSRKALGIDLSSKAKVMKNCLPV